MDILIDVGGTLIKIAKSDDLNNVTTIPTENDYDLDLKNIKDTIGGFSQNIEKIKICVPGKIDERVGTIIFSPNLSSWNQKNIVNDLESILNCPVVLTNDAVAGALGAVNFLNIKENSIFITWGTGVGGARIFFSSDGEVEITQLELGHEIIDIDGPDCNCGSKGCLEAFIGESGLKKIYGKKASELSEEEKKEVLERFATGLINILRLSRVKKIILAGGLSFYFKDSIENLKRMIAQMDGDLGQDFDIVFSSENSGLIGLQNLK